MFVDLHFEFKVLDGFVELLVVGDIAGYDYVCLKLLGLGLH